MKKKRLGIILLLIFISGVGILFYPTISDYHNSKVQSVAITNYDKIVEDIDYWDWGEDIPQSERKIISPLAPRS